MKKILSLLLIFASLLLVVSCGSKQYTITFDSMGGTAVEAQTTDKSGKITEPAEPKKDDYLFSGWYKNSDLSGTAVDFASEVFKEDTTLYAGWALAYKISFEANGGSAVAEVTTDASGKITAPKEPTKEYYTFAGWYKNSDLSGTAVNFTSEVFTADTKLYAKWELLEVMSYKEFMACEGGDYVAIEGYIADRQSWWNNSATLYLVDGAGEGYFIYGMTMTEEEFNTVYTIGARLRVYGTKTIYAGEHEIMGANINYSLTEVITDAPKMQKHVKDITYSVAAEDLEEIQNAYFTATLKVKQYSTTDSNATVAASGAYGYKGDLKDGSPADDLYFILEDRNGNELSCCIESYLTGPSSEVYQAVLSGDFAVGKLVKVTGYMYWYNGANPHIVSISFDEADDAYELFLSTPDGEEVKAAGYVISKTTYYNGTTCLYVAGTQTNSDFTAAEGYYVYNYSCTLEQYNQLVVNANQNTYTYVTITGTKASYAGMQEIIDATVTIGTGSNSPVPLLINTGFGASSNGVTLDNVQEQFIGVLFNGTFKVKEYTTTDQNATVGESKAYGYKGDTPTDDLYFILEDAYGNELSCCIEAYVDYSVFGESHKSTLYSQVMGLQIGDTINVSGFLYWWNGPNPHIFVINKA